MLKSKFMFGLVAMAMLLVLSQNGFAQLSVGVTGNPHPRETETNRTAETNDPSSGNAIIITGEALSAAPFTGARLRLDWPTTITNSTGFPALDGIRIESATGLFLGSSIESVDNVEGRVNISMPCRTPATGDTGTIILSGVRIDVNGVAPPINAAVSFQSGQGSMAGGSVCPAGSVSASNVLLQTTSFESITDTDPGIASVAVGSRTGVANLGTGTIFTNRNVADATASFVVTEGHTRAWYDSLQFSGAGTVLLNDAGFRLTFNGIPANVTLTLSLGSASSGTPTFSRTTITQANNTSIVTFGPPPATVNYPGTSADQVQVNVAVSVTGTPTLTAGNITVTAAMNPVGNALTDTDPPGVDTTALPRFASVEVGPATIVSIIAANSTLLIPFAVRDGGFDTGLAIANTTADPFGGAANGGATPQSGGIRIDYFPRAATGAGTPGSITTSSTIRPGVGLSADGTLAAGSTWSVLLSELFTAAGQTAPFTGYLFVRTDFLNAHGATFVSNFAGFTSATPTLTVPSPSITPRGNFESLGF
jgi:hypothetical protein